MHGKTLKRKNKKCDCNDMLTSISEFFSDQYFVLVGDYLKYQAGHNVTGVESEISYTIDYY